MHLATRVKSDVSGLRRRLVSVVVWLVLSMFVATASATTPSTSGGSVEDTSAPPSYALPLDQPELTGPLPAVPEPPPSFATHDSGWIRFAYPRPVEERIQSLIKEAEETRGVLRERLGQPVLTNVTVYVARTAREMASLAPPDGRYPRYASGVAYSQIGLILLTLQPENPNTLHDLDEIFRHELAHVALYDAVGRKHLVPRWFNEGFAVHASGESSLARLQTLWTATLAGDLIPLSRLENGFPNEAVRASVAYAESADVVRFLLKREDRERFEALIRRLRAQQSFETAMADAYGLDLASLEYEWREEVAKRYSFWPVFFSGSLVWMGALSLFFFGWRRRRRKSQATLERWSREEAMEDARRASSMSGGRVHIVFPSAASQSAPDLPPPLPKPTPSEGSDVPKVEHDGRWHTLH